MTQGETNDNDVAAHAIDGDLSTVAATSTDGGYGWMTLQFEEPHMIERVMIYYKFFTDWYDPAIGCVESEIRFKSCVANDNNVDVSVYKGDVKQKSCGRLQLIYGLEQSDQVYTLVCDAEGDMVKLSKNSGMLAVCEVVVLSHGAGKLINKSENPSCEFMF